jgi:preprotein translocase subunit YajC
MNDLSLLVILAVFVVFIFFSNRKRKAATQQLADSVKVGAKAVMLGGITGTIVEVKDDSLIVETVPGTKIEFLKAAVRTVSAPSLDEKPAKAETAKKTAAAKPVVKAATKPAAKTTAKPAVKKTAK